MAVTNHDRVGSALNALHRGLLPFVAREYINHHRNRTVSMLEQALNCQVGDPERPFDDVDLANLLRLMWDSWHQIYRKTLGQAERALVSELRDTRNRWAHPTQKNRFSGDDTYRALDSAQRLLAAVDSADEAEGLEKLKNDLLRLRFDEQRRTSQRRAAASIVESAAAEAIMPWRDVVTPHPDVSTGRFQQAEFAADLWQVHQGQGSDEYRDPAEFFRRTFLTTSLKQLLAGSIGRLSGGAGDPVVQLQTNFGGGKTHSMLALYHLFGGSSASALAGVEELLSDADVDGLPDVKRVVLVGNKISPGNPVTKPDGTVVRTLWGELAHQLGGAEAFARIAADDERATSPGDRLLALLDDYGPCLVLIDEWVAYARQLHDDADLPGGTFETQFTFAQTLTEAARTSERSLVLISLPASDMGADEGPRHAQADDAEVGGLRGREALNRLRHVIGRMDAAWRPATAEEGFEIVRRRLFEPLDADAFTQRDVTARAFRDLYQSQQGEFPQEAAQADYERRIQSAFPIHPEIFDRLYGDWSSLVSFQRTRGVLRMMATVIHSLWSAGDRNPLILPSTIPISDPRVQFELTRYMPDNWVPVITVDVDGAASLPVRIDSEVTNLGRLRAACRVARTIYLGSAPTLESANRGVEDRRIKLGCVMPGESPQVFGDAVRRLVAAGTYLYQDGSRYWFSTRPTVAKLAADLAAEFARSRDEVHRELSKRLAADVQQTGRFGRVHTLPRSSSEIPDEAQTRLVVLDPEQPHTRGAATSEAQVAADEILRWRGSAPRVFRNALVFLAADGARYADLDDALCRWLAWESIVRERDKHNLDPHQFRQAEAQKAAAGDDVAARLGEAYRFTLVPSQPDPTAEVTWHAVPLSGSEPLAERASGRLIRDDLLVPALGVRTLRRHLDEVPLWRGDHVALRMLADDFFQQLYLPRLADPEVLAEAVRAGVSMLTWRSEGFAYAEEYDEPEGRYAGLRAGEQMLMAATDPGLIVRPELAAEQMVEDARMAGAASIDDESESGWSGARGGRSDLGNQGEPEGDTASNRDEVVDSGPATNRRYHGAVQLDPERVGLTAGQVAEEIVAHLVGLEGAEVRVTLEIDARIPDGAPSHVVRIVTENSNTLGFETGSGFERE